jgi:hypothetical protein
MGALPSVTVTLTEYMPVLVVVPLIVPEADIVNPLGRPVADHVFVDPPPVAANVYVYGAPAVAWGRARASVIPIGEITRENE